MGKAFEMMLGLLIKLVGASYFLVMLAVTIFTWVSDNVVGLTLYVVEGLAAVYPVDTEIGLTDFMGILSLINSLIPLQEAWAIAVFSVPYAGIIVVYRFIKQFIPTLSN